MEKATLGVIVRNQRKRLNWTTEKLARKAQVDRTTLTKLETKNILPSCRAFKKVWRELKLDDEVLMRFYQLKYPDIIAFTKNHITVIEVKSK